jgi:hypothetical protein
MWSARSINPNGALNVKAWAATQDENRLFLSILTLGEYEKGIHNVPDDHPNRPRFIAARDGLAAGFAGRILSVGDAVVLPRARRGRDLLHAALRRRYEHGSRGRSPQREPILRTGHCGRRVTIRASSLALAYFGEDLDAMMALADRALSINPSYAVAGLSAARSGAGQGTSMRLSRTSRPHCASARTAESARLSSTSESRFPEWPLRGGPSETPPVNSGRHGGNRALSVSRRLLRTSGTPWRGAGDTGAAACDHAAGNAEPRPMAQPRPARTIPLGPAPGDGRDRMSQMRRLAAVLAAYVAGYWWLIGTEEGGPSKQLGAICVELTEPKIAEHYSRISWSPGRCMSTGPVRLLEISRRAVPRKCGLYRGTSSRTNPSSQASFLRERRRSERF